MEWAKTLERLPVWNELTASPPAYQGDQNAQAADLVEPDRGLVPDDQWLCDLVATQWLPSPDSTTGWRLGVFIVTSQTEDQNSNGGSQVTLQVHVNADAAPSPPHIFHVAVPGYDILKNGPFLQIIVNA